MTLKDKILLLKLTGTFASLYGDNYTNRDLLDLKSLINPSNIKIPQILSKESSGLFIAQSFSGYETVSPLGFGEKEVIDWLFYQVRKYHPELLDDELLSNIMVDTP